MRSLLGGFRFLRSPRAASARTLDRRVTVENIGHLLGDTICGHPQGFVDMDLAVSDASGGMPQQRGDRQLGKTESAGEARERLTQLMRRDIGELGALAIFRIASPPGIGAFVANAEYAHGGISLQKCLVPDLVVERGEAGVAATITGISWRGMRCRVTVESNAAGLQTDLRLN